MIVTVRSTISTFKAVTFKAGLNVLLADVTDASTEKQTRNSAGKTSLVEIIHFLLGSEADKKSLFKKPDIVGHAFTGVLLLDGRYVAVTRACGEDREVLVADVSDLPEWSGHVGDTDCPGTLLTLDGWKARLGQAWFDIPADPAGTPFATAHAPTFRSLIGYFARRRKSGGYNAVERQNDKQQPWDWQVNVSYLLGLGWEVSRKFQDLRTRKSATATLKKAIKEGEFGELFGTTAEIRPELLRTEERISKLKAQIDNFTVHERYREFAERAAQLKDALSDAALELASLDETVAHLENAVQAEEAPAYASVERLYEAAGVQLPGLALRRFDEVKAFQASVTENRRRHLTRQIDEAKARKQVVDGAMARHDAERAAILKNLEGKGAFEDLMHLREDLGLLSSRAETLRSKLQHATRLENAVTQIKLEGAALELELQEELKRQEEAIRRATVLVDEAIGELYDDRTGNLIIDASKGGLGIAIAIQGGGNLGGIDMMKIFCFDMMLLQMAAERFDGGPRFVLHDSHLFDGVDARQVRRAVTYGSTVAGRVKSQYLVAMNSDEYDRSALSTDPAVEAAVLPVRLTDGETGGLFGFRFD
ncbi:hypothetical protein LPLAFNJD_LOCUS1947 [Methylorubrum aminovorans]